MPALVSRARNDRFHAAHLALALALGAWRALEATPGWSSADGGSFSSSTLGRLSALATLLACVPALVLIAVESLRRWREPRVLLLAVLLALALAWRDGVDVFDLCYAAAAIALGVAWFTRDRAHAATLN